MLSCNWGFVVGTWNTPLIEWELVSQRLMMLQSSAPVLERSINGFDVSFLVIRLRESNHVLICVSIVNGDDIGEWMLLCDRLFVIDFGGLIKVGMCFDKVVVVVEIIGNVGLWKEK